MPGVTRIGDITIGVGSHGLPCCPHVITGIVITSSPSTYAESLGMARIGDLTSHNCPHCPIGILLTGSPTTFAESIPLSRLTDVVNEVCGTGNVVTASGTTFADG